MIDIPSPRGSPASRTDVWELYGINAHGPRDVRSLGRTSLAHKGLDLLGRTSDLFDWSEARRQAARFSEIQAELAVRQATIDADGLDEISTACRKLAQVTREIADA